MAVTDLS